MNKKTIFKLALLLLMSFSTKNFSQTVTLTVSSVNNIGISSSQPITISANTTASIQLDTQVTLSSIPSDSNPGTIKIYYQKNSSSPINVANGGDGGGLLFLGSTTAYRSFNITLNSGQFDATGGYIYSEYQTSSGLKYKSANRAVVVSTPTGGGGGTGGGGTGTSCNITVNVPYNELPIVPTFPNSNSNNIWNGSVEDYTGYTKSNITVDFSNPLSSTVSSAALYQRNSSNIPPELSCLFIYRVSTFFRNYRNYTFQLHNEINSSQDIYNGQNASILIGEVGRVTYTTGGGTRGSISVRNDVLVENYQWQKRIKKQYPTWSQYNSYIAIYGWKDIPNATQKDYNPGLINEPTEFRRLLIENPNDPVANRRTAASNVVNIIPVNLTNITNTICCNQIVEYGSSPNVLAGNSLNPTNNLNYEYQWQISKYINTNWVDILYANDKDYLPVKDERLSSGDQKYFYRRIVINPVNNSCSISNQIEVIFKWGRGTRSRMQTSDDDITKSENIKLNETVIYPNPFINELFINTNNNLSVSEVKIFDITNRIVYKTIINTSENTTNIDVSNLPKGFYNITIENNNELISKKIIKN